MKWISFFHFQRLRLYWTLNRLTVGQKTDNASDEIREELIFGVRMLGLARGRRSIDLCSRTQAELVPPFRFLSGGDDKGGFCCNVGHLHSKSHSGLSKAKAGLNGQFAPLVWLVGR